MVRYLEIPRLRTVRQQYSIQISYNTVNMNSSITASQNESAPKMKTIMTITFVGVPNPAERKNGATDPRYKACLWYPFPPPPALASSHFPPHYNAIFFLCSFCADLALSTAVLPLLVFRSVERGKDCNDGPIWVLVWGIDAIFLLCEIGLDISLTKYAAVIFRTAWRCGKFCHWGLFEYAKSVTVFTP